MSNFNFLVGKKLFGSLPWAAMEAERAVALSARTAVANCRVAMEMAVKWLYSADKSLKWPVDRSLYNLTTTTEFRKLLGSELLARIHLIRKQGNEAAHGSGFQNRETALAVLNCLFVLLDWMDQVYARGVKGRRFNEKLVPCSQITSTVNIAKPKIINPSKDFDNELEENEEKKPAFTEERVSQEALYQKPTADDITEAETRRLYIDTLVRDAGWVKNKDWVDEFPVEGMPSKSGIGFVDYVLLGDDGVPLAIIEAKKASVLSQNGHHQAILYAEQLEKRYGVKPVVFLSNGFETLICNDGYPLRPVSGIYSKDDLLAVRFKQKNRSTLDYATPNKDIAGRPYQVQAISAVCNHFKNNFRKALLVMATGSGKTRTVMALVELLMKRNWVKNVLFLADRNCLVTQAYKNAVNLLPDIPVTNLCDEKDKAKARFVFSTYQTMMGCIESARTDEGKRLYTCGHFDLIICDEAHRSIYKKYQELFHYFDSLLVGLTATPKDEIDRNTYSIFDLPTQQPTFNYDYSQAVQEGYLVPYNSVEVNSTFMRTGIKYDDLSDEEKELWEETFGGEEFDVIPAAAVNSWVFNEDTVSKALHELMTKGIKVDYGNKIGKTIIFARNHQHAEFIKTVFDKQYPHLLNEFCAVIDNQVRYVENLIERFEDVKKNPQIAVSVDMLDTGIDVPECVNLVFFKPVFSKAKFWQMIGRGTRKCAELLDGQDKDRFLIFDLCGNFKFFDKNPNGIERGVQASLEERIFNLQVNILYDLQQKLEDSEEKTRERFIEELLARINAIPQEIFPANQHKKALVEYSQAKAWTRLSTEAPVYLSKELAHLVVPIDRDGTARRFDALMYGLELRQLRGESVTIHLNKLRRLSQDLLGLTSIPEIKDKEELLRRIADEAFVVPNETRNIETIRENLRNLIKFIPQTQTNPYFIDLVDTVEAEPIDTGNLITPELVEYRERVEGYVRTHAKDGPIAKIHANEPLTSEDVQELERILWSELGTKDEYQGDYGDQNIGVLIRKLIGLNRSAAEDVFNTFVRDKNLNDSQLNFINMIVNYVVQNGMLDDKSVLINDEPFKNYQMTEIFPDLSVLFDVMKAVDDINSKARA